jgi:hypothetical protein
VEDRISEAVDELEHSDNKKGKKPGNEQNILHPLGRP